MRKGMLIFGIGVNNANYNISSIVDGKDVRCKFYSTWYEMIRRCYSSVYQRKNTSYIGCSVCPDWLYFMNFRAWMVTQNWKGKCLDKDLLVHGNKVYSPDTCIFIDQLVNKFIIEHKTKDDGFPVGVSYHTGRNLIVANISGLGGSQKHLGCFPDSESASKVYWLEKKKLAFELALMQDDDLISELILKRYKITESNNERR